MAAALFALRNLTPPAIIWTDHKAIVTGIARGKAWCQSAKRASSDLWRDIWHKLEDIGIGEAGVTVKHTKAHRSDAGIQELPADQRRIAQANKVADASAKEAASGDDQGGMAPAGTRPSTGDRNTSQVRSSTTHSWP